MTSWPEAEAEILGDFEKNVSWDLTLGEASPAGGYGMRGAFIGPVSWDLTLSRNSPAGELTVGDVGTVSIVKIVSLSPRVERLKLKTWINVSYLNYRESSVFRDFSACIWICKIFIFWLCYKQTSRPIPNDIIASWNANSII